MGRSLSATLDRATRSTERLPLRVGFDVVVTVGLAVLAYLTRVGGLPESGLFFDDSWVAAGVISATPTNLLQTGSGHALFTAMLAVQRSVAGGDIWTLSYPAFVAGVAGPPLVYVALRRIGYVRSICVLLASALVVADVHILYASRIKTYAFDPLIVLALVVIIPRLARKNWRWQTGAAWIVGSVVVGLLSGFALFATSAAGGILALHARGDARVRRVAVSVQAGLVVLYLLAAQRSTDLAEIEASQEQNFDGHLEFTWNPIELVGELMLHLRRLASVYPGGPDWFLNVVVVVGISGLVVSALSKKRSDALRGRFLLLIVGLAIVGGFLGRFPFGTTNNAGFSSGGRHSMWLTPVLLVGIAAALHRIRALIRAIPARRALDLALLVSAGLVLVGGYEDSPAYLNTGTSRATAYVEETLGPDDVVIVEQFAIYSFASVTTFTFSPRPTPDRMIGFTPDYDDARIVNVGAFGEVSGTKRDIRSIVAGVDRVFVIDGFSFGALLPRVIGVLEAEGFTITREFFGNTSVYRAER